MAMRRWRVLVSEEKRLLMEMECDAPTEGAAFQIALENVLLFGLDAYNLCICTYEVWSIGPVR